MAQQAASQGFTLIEMMVTIAVMLILMAVALPNFQSFIAGQRVQSANSDLISALLMARSEAMKRNVTVDVVPNAAGWASGWTVQYGGGTIIQKQDPLNSGVQVVEKDSGGTETTATITFGWNGRPQAGSAGSSFTVSTTTANPIPIRCITLGLAGLPETKRDSDGNAANGCQ